MSPPSPNGKPPSSRPSLLVPLLIVLALLALVLLAVFLFLFLRSPADVIVEPEAATNHTAPYFKPADRVKIVGRPNQATTATTVTMRTTTEKEETTESTKATVEQTTVEATTERVEGEKAKERKEEEERVDECARRKVERTSCAEVMRVPATGPSTNVDLVHYSLNLTTSYQVHFVEDAEIYLQPKEAVKQIVLAAGRHLRAFDNIAVLDCASGEVICSSVEHDLNKELLSIGLASPSSSLLRLVLKSFHSVSAPGLYSQVPGSFNRQLPSLIGSNFASDDEAKQVFPVLPNRRASLALCLHHEPADAVTSVLPRHEMLRTRRDTKTTTCFERTQPIQQKHFAFLAHQKTESVLFNASSPVHPSIEVIFSFSFGQPQRQWIQTETDKILSTLSSWFSFPYPLRRLTLVDAPLPVSPASSPLGFVLLKSGSLRDSRDATMRQSLLRHLAGQWIGGVVSADACMEEALTTYLVWKLNDELTFVPGQETTKDKVRLSRPASLDNTTKPTIGRRLGRPTKSVCPDRLPSIFASLDASFGPNTTRTLVSTVLHRHAFQAVPLSAWTEALVEITGNDAAGSYLRDWFTAAARPLLSVRKERTGLNVTQVAAPGKAVHLWNLPVEMEGKIVQVAPQENQLLPMESAPSDCLLLDPHRKSTAMVLYDLETYQCVISCSSNSKCSVSQDEIQSILADFGAFFTGNLIQMDAAERGRLAAWQRVLSAASMRKALTGNAACCAEQALRSPPRRECSAKFVYVDVCDKIELSRAILGVA